MKRIGIFGGSFNPIHLGHTALAAYVCEQGLTDEVWLMVSPQNPLKQDLTLLDEQERFAMACLAVTPYPMLHASDFEFRLPRPSYTYHTLQALRTAYPDKEFSLVIGEDNWQCFDRWYRYKDILRDTPIIIYPRQDANMEQHSPTYDVPRLQAERGKQSPDFNSQPTFLTNPPLLPYSSTEIRHIIAQGRDATHMLHPDVAKYLKEKRHYTCQL